MKIDSIIPHAKPRNLKDSLCLFDLPIVNQCEGQVMRDILRTMLHGDQIDNILQPVQFPSFDKQLKGHRSTHGEHRSIYFEEMKVRDVAISFQGVGEELHHVRRTGSLEKDVEEGFPEQSDRFTGTIGQQEMSN